MDIILYFSCFSLNETKRNAGYRWSSSAESTRFRALGPRASAWFWLGGPLAAWGEIFCWKFDYEMVHSEVYLNKYVVSIAPFSTPACLKTALFACFRFLIFHPFSRGSAEPICPYVRTPMTRSSRLSTRKVDFALLFYSGGRSRWNNCKVVGRRSQQTVIPNARKYLISRSSKIRRGCKLDWRHSADVSVERIDRRLRETTGARATSPHRRRGALTIADVAPKQYDADRYVINDLTSWLPVERRLVSHEPLNLLLI